MPKTLMLVLFFSMGACASNLTEPSNNPQQDVANSVEVIEVAMLKYKFIPEVMEIKVGQTVHWINQEKRQYHSIWFEKNGGEESDYLFPDDVLEKVFDTPGVYNYRCGPHPKMIGKIIVR